MAVPGEPLYPRQCSSAGRPTSFLRKFYTPVHAGIGADHPSTISTGLKEFPRTLMRAPVVKRQTPPESGFLAFFPPSRSWRSPPLALWSDLISLGWCRAHGAAPHTYGGSTAIPVASAARVRTALCPRETSLHPHTVLLKRRAAHRGAPVRSRFGGGAAPRSQPSLAPAGQEPEQASKHTHRVRA